MKQGARLLAALGRSAGGWVALTIAASLLVCASVVGLQLFQERSLARASAIVGELRLARIDLYQGVMHALLGDKPDSPWEPGRGRVLIRQALEEFRSSLNQIPDGPATDALEHQLQEFERALEAVRRTDPLAELNLRVALFRLNSAALLVDQQTRTELMELRRTQREAYAVVLAVAAVLLALISAGAVRLRLREASAAAAQRESELRFAVLFQQNPEPTLVHSKGRVELANPAALRALGAASVDALAAVPLLDLIGEADRQRVVGVLAELAPAPAVATSATHFSMRRLDGSEFAVEAATASFRQGEGTRMLSVFRDVTARLAAACALAASERRLRDVLDLVPHGIYAKDIAGRYLLVNRFAAERQGCGDPEAMLGRAAEEFALAPQDAEDERESDRRVLEARERHDGAVVYRRFGDVSRALAINKMPFRFGGQEVDSVLSVATDVTWLKRSEARLQESLALLEATLQSTDNGVLVAGPDGGLLLWNQQLLELPGGREGIAQASEAAVLAAIALHQPPPAGATPASHVARRPDGSYVETHWQPMVIEGRPAGRVWSFRDVTQRERALADAQTREQELERRVQERTADLAQAYADLQTFSDAVSHDLRTPLAAMDTFAHTVLRKYGDGLAPQARHYLERVVAGAASMGQMIEGLLELSRHARAPVHRRPLDLGRMAREAFDLQAQTLAGRHVEFEVADGLEASGDPVLVATLLQNLIGNALKYSRQRDPARIEVGARRDGGRPRFYVRDNGAGFDPAYADRLFKPFSRLHGADEFEGHGIGLATVNRIVARHGGRIWAEGAEGQGATFWFTARG